MDGSLSSEEELLCYEPGEWEKREKDSALFEHLELLFQANELLPNVEENKARMRKLISEEIDSEDIRRKLLEEIREVEEFERDHQRKPPSLKVFSAMTICKKFKNSEEIRSLESSAGHISWSGICDEECEPFSPPTCENGRLQAEEMLSLGMIEKLEDWHCGFCRFSKWIKAQKIPEETKVYCKNILHFLEETGRFPGTSYYENEEQHQEENK